MRTKTRILASATTIAAFLAASQAHAGFRDVVVTSIVFNDVPASGGDIPSPAGQVAYVTIENKGDVGVGSGVPCDLSTGYDCLSHRIELSIAGRTGHAGTNTLGPRSSVMVPVSFPPGTLSHCQTYAVGLVGTWDGDALWALSNTTIRAVRNGDLRLCRVFPSPAPVPLPIPTFPPIPYPH